LGFGFTYHHFISDQYQPAALLGAVSTVLSIANDRDCGIAIFVANYGLALLVAMLRALFLQSAQQQDLDQNKWNRINLGNYWMDIIRPLFRFFIPLGLFFLYCSLFKVCQQPYLRGQQRKF
jgi:K+-transporting ATPase A subunit